MGKIVGIVLAFGGVAGYLYSWIHMQKEKEMRLEEFIFFLQKTIFAMETENVKVMEYFARYESKNGQMCGEKGSILEKSLHEIAKRLATYTYPKGQEAWEEVFKEEEQAWAMDSETFGVMLHAGAGFFGRSRQENICFLQKSIDELEKQQVKLKENDAQQRKVWIPVGMLGTVMLLIVFV
ncbi:MAG: hypothetical protein IJ455_02185 [Agathobacter sp.]|nr:hypothetical protein [Agathobacter sp.]